MSNLTKNMENYLEAIYVLSMEKKVVRLKDISKKLEVSMPSVHTALQNLSRKGFLYHERYGYIELTEKGEAIGSRIYVSHQLLSKFLTEILNVSPCIAEQDACNIEHDISRETLDKLILFLKFIDDTSEQKVRDWLTGFRRHCRSSKPGSGLKQKNIN